MKSKNFQCGLYEPDIDLICDDSLKKMEIAIIVEKYQEKTFEFQQNLKHFVIIISSHYYLQLTQI